MEIKGEEKSEMKRFWRWKQQDGSDIYTRALCCRVARDCDLRRRKTGSPCTRDTERVDEGRFPPPH